MAPDIALEHVRDLPDNALIADPMCGSGTVLRVAAECGHRCIGFDLDPLAVLMSRVWTTAVDLDAVRTASAELIAAGNRLEGDVALPWIDGCPETCAFVDRWFEPPQREPLRRIAYLLAPRVGPIADVLRLALSRTIITKERGASIARDTSHSRPHTWFVGNTYDVWKGFEIAIERLSQRLRPEEVKGTVVANQGDAPSRARWSRGCDHLVTAIPERDRLSARSSAGVGMARIRCPGIANDQGSEHRHRASSTRSAIGSDS